MTAFEMTASGILRALTSIDEAVRGKAEALAARLERDGIEARVEREGDASYSVVATGEDLFAREFGSLNGQADAPIESAIESLRAGTAE